MKYLFILTIALFAIVGQPTLASAENHWHVSTYWAEYIAGHGLGNHALYCGDETIPACDPPDTLGGVGPSWIDEVEWRSSVADTSQSVTVRLTGLMNYDLPDEQWDFLVLYVQRGGEIENLASWTGTNESTIYLDFTTVLSPGDYSGPESDEVRLVWRVWTSDDGWDDVDCINPSHGACQIDDLSVYMDGDLVTFDDFEPGNPVNWDPVIDLVSAVDQVPGLGQTLVTAHPNPFNPQTKISFSLPQDGRASIRAYDLSGHLVKVLAEDRYPAGDHSVDWNGRDAAGRELSSGTYIVRLEMEEGVQATKVMLIR